MRIWVDQVVILVAFKHVVFQVVELVTTLTQGELENNTSLDLLSYNVHLRTTPATES